MADTNDTDQGPDTPIVTDPKPIAQPNAPGASLDGFNALATGQAFAEPSEAPTDWSLPGTDAQGFALDGHGFPINLRLRAAALADAGKDEDPVGNVPPETIAAERERLEAFDKAYPALHANTAVKEVDAIAKAEGVDISAATNNAERVALIAAARPSRV